MSTTGIIIGILVAAVLLVFAEMYRELHTFMLAILRQNTDRSWQLWKVRVRSLQGRKHGSF